MKIEAANSENWEENPVPLFQYVFMASFQWTVALFFFSAKFVQFCELLCNFVSFGEYCAICAIWFRLFWGKMEINLVFMADCWVLLRNWDAKIFVVYSVLCEINIINLFWGCFMLYGPWLGQSGFWGFRCINSFGVCFLWVEFAKIFIINSPKYLFNLRELS